LTGTMSKQVVGVPRALGFFEYFPLWETFLERLGAEVLVSGRTGDATVSRGTRLAVEESCLPVKVYLGHVADLRERVDYLFVPRLVAVQPKVYTCPKFLGLPEMVQSTFEHVPPLLTPEFNSNRRPWHTWRELLAVGRALGRGAAATMAAYRAGQRRLHQEQQGDAPLPTREGPPVVGVLGHPYMLHDDRLNLNLLHRLRRLGVQVVTCEMVPESTIVDEVERLPKRLFWAFARRTMGSALHLARERLVDGFIHVVPFGCGSDALISELAQRLSRRLHDAPFMLLTLDEHTGEAGVVTRLEAFVDMVSRRRTA